MRVSGGVGERENGHTLTASSATIGLRFNKTELFHFLSLFAFFDADQGGHFATVFRLCTKAVAVSFDLADNTRALNAFREATNERHGIFRAVLLD